LFAYHQTATLQMLAAFTQTLVREFVIERFEENLSKTIFVPDPDSI
jgi:hypothetical protein